MALEAWLISLPKCESGAAEILRPLRSFKTKESTNKRIVAGG